MAVGTAMESPLWRRIACHYHRLLDSTKWLVGKGNIFFRTDNWAGQILRGPLPYDVRQRREWVPIPGRITGPNSNEDRLIFMFTDSGDFSTKEYCKLLNPALNKKIWAKWALNSMLPPNIQVFLWKLIRHALPVHCRILSQGVFMVSRCSCWKTYQEESLTHLFLNSELAKEVWRCFGILNSIL